MPETLATTPSLPVAPQKAPAPPSASTSAPAGHELALAWIRANPACAAILGAIIVTLAIFYGAVPMFWTANQGRQTAAKWIWGAWNPETHYEHGPLVPFIILFLIWNALPKLRGVPATPSSVGLVPLIFGVLLFLLSERSLQPRFAWGGLPFILFGGVLFAAGWRWARTLLFPILCVFFLIPMPGIDQRTVELQIMATKGANFVCNMIGIKMIAVGTTLKAMDGGFQFDVIGDCSGINSLMAITLMTAVFAHLTQDRLWKMLVLFAASAPVAIIGNLARLTAIMIVAKCFGQGIAGGWFHEISAYIISFPFAFGTLCLVNKLLNWNSGPASSKRPGLTQPASPAPQAAFASASPATSGKSASYDY